MRQYSTPQLKFRLRGNDLDTVLGGTCYLSFGKLDDTTNTFTHLFDADYEVENVNGRTFIKTTLTQEQTGQFAPNTNAWVQFRSKNGDKSVVTSAVPVRVLPTIKAEVV
jgi:hypothetical protein